MNTLRNYQPHNKWNRVRVFTDHEQYLQRLSADVKAACNRFFAKRGIVESYQFGNTIQFNRQNSDS